MTINDIYTMLVEYIEHNKTNNNINYIDTIDVLKEIIQEIERDYKEV